MAEGTVRSYLGFGKHAKRSSYSRSFVGPVPSSKITKNEQKTFQETDFTFGVLMEPQKKLFKKSIILCKKGLTSGESMVSLYVESLEKGGDGIV
jgi:hypothetical protein